MKDVGQRGAEVAALKHAFPYIRMFQGKTFVVKAGGGALGDDAAIRALVEQVGLLHQLGIRVVLVHGGGPQASELARALGAEPRFVAGRRVTDDARPARWRSWSSTAAQHAAPRRLPRGRAAGGRASRASTPGWCGRAGGRRSRSRASASTTARRRHRGRRRAACSTRLLAAGFVPVVSPLSADDAGTLLNVNADSVAAALAVALGAEKLILLTGAPGILERPEDPGSLVSYTDLAGLRRLRAGRSAARRHAAQGGGGRERAARRRASGRTSSPIASPDSLLVEVFTNEGSGTLVVADLARPLRRRAGGRPGGRLMLAPEEVLTLHREIVAIPSLSGSEAPSGRLPGRVAAARGARRRERIGEHPAR